MNKSIKLTIVAVGLLGVLALSHRLTGTTLDDIMANKPSESGKKKKQEEEPHKKTEGGKVQLPPPMGSPDAPVKIKVYVTTDNECDTTTLNGMKKIAAEFGDNVYIEYDDLLKKDVLDEAQKAKISCKSGVLINGKSQFVLPERGLNGTVMLDGPLGEKNYDMKDIKAIVRHLLEKAGRLKNTQEAPGS